MTFRIGLTIYLAAVWLLVPYPLGFWLFILSASIDWALKQPREISRGNLRPETFR